ncbi:variant surface antigen E-like [Antechinus flavipes]|uniref:variant surface antigen E-like n=1 Tax=Antechinus flavipes TaxID=38775 RepID=UPI00223640BA|nr:variant surface antigen E-like [Antechinus flavipes]
MFQSCSGKPELRVAKGAGNTEPFLPEHPVPAQPLVKASRRAAPGLVQTLRAGPGWGPQRRRRRRRAGGGEGSRADTSSYRLWAGRGTGLEGRAASGSGSGSGSSSGGGGSRGGFSRRAPTGHSPPAARCFHTNPGSKRVGGGGGGGGGGGTCPHPGQRHRAAPPRPHPASRPPLSLPLPSPPCSWRAEMGESTRRPTPTISLSLAGGNGEHAPPYGPTLSLARGESTHHFITPSPTLSVGEHTRCHRVSLPRPHTVSSLNHPLIPGRL